jgi:hypothetical protein
VIIAGVGSGTLGNGFKFSGGRVDAHPAAATHRIAAASTADR